MTNTCQSLLTRFYYNVKPFVPLPVRWALRRRKAAVIRERSTAVWPINESAGQRPAGWPGWPDGKRFALVLTHDVESRAGLEKVKPLAELEMKCGVRSSFNFIPEGNYKVPVSLREWLVSRDFEVGVHDLKHDGKLYQSRARFGTKAKRINHYLHQWNAKGFRSGFMLRQLDWLHDLDIEYECSTFDTDPFEPQPAGAHTVFPYWIQGASGGGYVELPYTLPQDSTMFLLLRERDTDIWERKTEWIARRGGMVLMNVHPDYLDFDGSRDSMTFPASLYEGFLHWVMERFGTGIWHALPRDVAHFVSNHHAAHRDDHISWPSNIPERLVKVWIDLENTPHIPFFLPIIRDLQERGHEVHLTARDGYQTCEMAGFHSMPYLRIGRHYGRHLVFKVWGLVVRGIQLTRFASRERPDLALNLGSRSQNLAAKLLGIPVVEIMDYEHSAELSFLEPRWYLKPDVVGTKNILESENVRIYHGLKEDIYVPDFKPDESILDELGLRNAKIVVTVRPAATEAHYHNPDSELLFEHLMQRLLDTPGAKVVLLPRNKRQESELRLRYPGWFDDLQVVIPERIVNGLNLIWFSDLVVSGGGTMNREAAALGVPVYSIFRGRIGAVDQHLCDQKRLVLIETPTDVDVKIRIEPRLRRCLPVSRESGALSDILGHLHAIIASLGQKPLKAAA